jgi:uncharacterized protein DUF2612
MSTVQEFDYSVDVEAALLWQYSNSPNLLSIITQMQAWYDENQTEFWTDWFNNVFNLQTANQFGCSVWAIILDIPIIVATSPSNPEIPGIFFSSEHANFSNGNFFNNNNSAVQLTVAQAIIVLRMRYYQLTSRGTVPEINAFLADLFSDLGPAYVLDGYNMTAEYIFEFVLPSPLEYIFNNYDILPRPAGVGVTYRVLFPAPFGFDQPNNFNNGNFLVS